MKRFLSEPTQQLLSAINNGALSKEQLLFRAFPKWLLEILRGYFKVETRGAQFLPLEGPALVIANHSGFVGMDALMLANEIRRQTARTPRILTHRLWFSSESLEKLSTGFGFVKADLEQARQVLEDGEILLFFPEGEDGNFKPTDKRYQLRQFKRGFARLATQTKVPIIPAIVLGAEESNITLASLDVFKKYIGVSLPIPLNLIPLPVKWDIHFMKELSLADQEGNWPDHEDFSKMNWIAKKMRHHLQRKILLELRRRKNLSLRGMKLDDGDLPG